MPDQTLFERQMDEFKIDIREMRQAVTQMAQAMSKLAVLEERNVSNTAELNRLQSRTATTEQRITAIELHTAKFDGSVTGATTTVRILWAVGGGAVAYIAVPLLKLALAGAS